MHKIMRPACLLLPAIALASCGRIDTPPGERPAPAEVNVDPAKYLAKTEPADAKNVIAARKEVKDGEAVVLVGRIGGSKTPVSEERAVFTIVDLSLKSCEADPNCWDFA
jgi:hypothetical protein